MCGISGWVDFERDLRQSSGRPSQAMTETMACRGPGRAGLWLDPHAALGHRRLAVIDLEGGAPADDRRAGRATVAVADLQRRDLQLPRAARRTAPRRGHRFRTQQRHRGGAARPTWSGARTSPSGSTACSPSPSGTPAARSCCWSATGMGIKPLYYYPHRRRRAVRLRAQGDPRQPAGRAPASTPTACASCSPSSRRPGTPSAQGMREVRARPRRHGSTATACARRRYWGLEARAAHRRPGRPPSRTVRELLDDIVAPPARLRRAAVHAAVRRPGLLAPSPRSPPGARRARARGSAQLRRRLRRPDRELRRRRDARHPRRARTCTTSPARRRRPPATSSSTPPTSWTRRAAARSCTARDLPVGLGDMDTSLYLLFRAIREHSTVALSGESADEVFGGYRWFHDPEAVARRHLPVAGACRVRRLDRRRRPLLDAGPAPPSWTWPATARTSYREALAEVPRLPTARRGLERRMREICYLHLTRFVQHPAGPQGPDEHGRRPGGAGAVLRPPAGRVRLQRALGDEDLRRPGEEPAARRRPRRAAGLGRRARARAPTRRPRTPRYERGRPRAGLPAARPTGTAPPRR